MRELHAGELRGDAAELPLQASEVVKGIVHGLGARS
jgi:hypothetical protein